MTLSIPQNLYHKRILLCICGGIAAYKAPDLIRRLRERGAEVEVAMTQAAEEFITPLTLQAVAGRPIHRTLLPSAGDREEAQADAMAHISLARWADLLLVAPATANTLARLVQGVADDLVGAVCLACTARRMAAPAMNAAMWQDAATGRNVAQLAADGWQIAGPAAGDQACGDTGPGRMLEPNELVRQVAAAFRTGKLAGRSVLINAGPTHERIDPVRYISNRSSGRMGFALAEAAAEAGAQVRLIAGPVSLATPPGVERTDVVSAGQMGEQVLKHAAAADLFIAAAAVCDYRPAEFHRQKLKRSREGEQISIQMVRNPDIVAQVAALSPRPFILAFAAETQEPVRNAADKLKSKGVDMVAANDVSSEETGFDVADNEITLLSAAGGQPQRLPRAGKSRLARQLIARVARAMDAAADARPAEQN